MSWDDAKSIMSKIELDLMSHIIHAVNWAFSIRRQNDLHECIDFQPALYIIFRHFWAAYNFVGCIHFVWVNL
jgi:hypothetical protein